MIQKQQVENRLQGLNISKSPEPDGIHPRILRDLYKELAELITLLFTKSVSYRKLPDDWKEGCITPLYKKGNRQLASN